jgi:hypothetical protein
MMGRFGQSENKVAAYTTVMMRKVRSGASASDRLLAGAEASVGSAACFRAAGFMSHGSMGG